ncbi:MAG: dTDP-4-dehydrorhamnose 3,5-epimerase [Planctomycetales bacterium 12-60-4]|nr:MAG: dTDP-4-dehydrorhamnose 3,5-epimerase [Planctomycetales bacterium 12-60-4]
MHVRTTPLAGLVVIEPRVFADARGFFLETFQASRYRDAGLPDEWVQDNLSRSARGTLRGLHYQRHQPQGKLVYVTRGTVWDVAVDVRRNSPTFGRWHAEELSDENHRQMYLPPGFAHGFCVLTEIADFAYKCTDLYRPEDERTLLWNDPAIGIPWPDVEPRILSAKDLKGVSLIDADVYE